MIFLQKGTILAYQCQFGKTCARSITIVSEKATTTIVHLKVNQRDGIFIAIANLTYFECTRAQNT